MSKKSLPTLADEVVRATFECPDLMTADIRRLMHQARRFVLDDGMSEFLADIGWRAYKAKPEQQSIIMDQVRRLARAPFPVTWLEWSERPLARRAREVYSSDLNPDLVPMKCGWLMIQHPQIETAICTLNFGIGTSNFGSEGRLSFGATPFAFVWNTDDDPLPYKPHPLVEDEQLRRYPMSSIMTGLTGYNSPHISITDRPDLLPKGVETNVIMKRQLLEASGMMRYLLGFLAVLDDLPITHREVSTGKGFIARGNYRKFLQHRVVTLTVPSTEYRKLANRVVLNLRRRAHEVRGHWRKLAAFPPSALCAHDWQHMDEHTLCCSHCRGRKIWVHAHTRGDSSLGFVTHDYNVEHKAASN